MMDEVNETTSIFINAFPGAVNLQPNDIQVTSIVFFNNYIIGFFYVRRVWCKIYLMILAMLDDKHK
jgi:hypothetical protein